MWFRVRGDRNQPLPLYYFTLFWISSFVLEVNSNRNAAVADRPRLVVISMDGFRWDYLNGRAVTPSFDLVKTIGVHVTEGVQNVFITNTMPNHMSIATGLYVESHGITDNIIFDPEMNDTYVAVFYDHDAEHDPAWYGSISEPVWTSHQIQNDGKTGVLMWMGGETAFKGVHPTKFVKHTYVMDEIDEMNMVLDWLSDKDEPIDLVMAYFPQPDFNGHIYGPESIQVTRKIEYLDKALGHFIQQLKERNLSDSTDVLLVSDHGFTTTSRDFLILVDDILDPSWYTSVTSMPGPSMSIFPKEDRLDMVFAKLKASADSTGLFHVYRNHDIPERFHYKSHSRIPPIFAMAVLGYSFSTRDKLGGFEELKGNHGYDNQHQEMRPFFMAFGPSFQQGVSVETFQSVDIYPLMCHIKGIQPAPNNGSMETVSKLLRHYPGNQPHALTQPCDSVHVTSDNLDSSCPRQEVDDEIAHKGQQ